jgi:hypothetical protein
LPSIRYEPSESLQSSRAAIPWQSAAVTFSAS